MSDVVVAQENLGMVQPLAHYRARWDGVLACYVIEATSHGRSYKALYHGGDYRRLRALSRMFAAAADSAERFGCESPSKTLVDGGEHHG